MDQIFVALDLEMTGLDADVDEIIEVGLLKFQGKTILDTFETLVKPRRSLPLKITRITGIAESELATAPAFDAIAPTIVQFIKHYPLVGHSVQRDIEMLQSHGIHLPQVTAESPQKIYDTYELATLLLPNMPTYKLSTLAQQLGISDPAAHRALNDARVSYEVFVRLIERIEQLDTDTLRSLNRLMHFTDWNIADLFDAIYAQRPAGPLWSGQHHTTDACDVSDETDAIADYTQQPWMEKPLRPTGNNAPIDIDAVAAFFATDGVMSQVFAAYEQRVPQVDMARAVTAAFNDSETLLVEAGTGTGKSMAYLLPAALFALQRGERVVISTNTINLQDQLFFKDIPDVQQMLQRYATMHGKNPHSYELRAALLKGRSNYLCLRQYETLKKSNTLSAEDAQVLLKVRFWLGTTTTGDYNELRLSDREWLGWKRINVPHDSCTGFRCAHYHHCFFFKARRYAESVHVLVVNHALLLSDIPADSRVIPSYNHLIVDEAHNLEYVATDQLGVVIDQYALTQFYTSLFEEVGGDQTVNGLLAELPARLHNSIANDDAKEKMKQIVGTIFPLLQKARETTDASFQTILQFVGKEIESNDQNRPNHTNDMLYDVRLRITPTIRKRTGWADVEHAWDNLNKTVESIGIELGKLETLMTDVQDAEIMGYDELMMRVQNARRFTSQVRTEGGHIIFGDENNIYWVTLDRARDVVRLQTAPLNVADVLQPQLYAQKETIILTSATLSINDTFDFMCNRLGLVEPRELLLASPFDYEQQALVYIPDDMPEPNQRGYQQKLDESLIALCTATEGRTLALFTANSAIKKTLKGIQDALEDEQIVVLGQGIDGSRRDLLLRFQEWSRTVLLGTSSFWEGVDIVGDALSVLVITKLPFGVPSDPIYAARSEQYLDPFHDYALPQSILRFKQGFGRLIRSTHDRGVVVVFDKRLLSKKYGSLFLQSLPATRVRQGTLTRLPGVVTRFLETHAPPCQHPL